jgi:hypothetical protein
VKQWCTAATARQQQLGRKKGKILIWYKLFLL